jgi:hypothetical protein
VGAAACLAIVAIGAPVVHEYCWCCSSGLGCWQQPAQTPTLTAASIRLAQLCPPSPHPSFCCSRRRHHLPPLVCPTPAVRACSLCC